jgi:hypothetical protein
MNEEAGGRERETKVRYDVTYSRVTDTPWSLVTILKIRK